MSDEPNKVFESLLPTDFYLTNNPTDWRTQLMDEIRSIKRALNDKSIGRYSSLETYTGQTFFKSDDNNAERYLFRKVVDFGTLPNLNTKSVAHGIEVTATTYFINMYGVANLDNSYIPIPNYHFTGSPDKGLQLRADNTNVTIEVSNTNFYQNYTAYIVLEYLKY